MTELNTLRAHLLHAIKTLPADEALATVMAAVSMPMTRIREQAETIHALQDDASKVEEGGRGWSLLVQGMDTGKVTIHIETDDGYDVYGDAFDALYALEELGIEGERH